MITKFSNSLNLSPNSSPNLSPNSSPNTLGNIPHLLETKRRTNKHGSDQEENADDEGGEG